MKSLGIFTAGVFVGVSLAIPPYATRYLLTGVILVGLVLTLLMTLKDHR